MKPGDVIAGKYRVERVLGQGGMGVVVAAVHTGLGHRVALKSLLPKALEIPGVVTRFEREARAAAALESDHVSRMLDVGHLPDGAPYIVMELLEGKDLAAELRERGRLPGHEAAAYVREACDALAEAHRLGIVHRDIKPANLFLARRHKRAACIKVLDFGISKASSLADGDFALTSTTDLMGSPLYMSPEQLSTPKAVDGRTDIWSLGATLFELVAGLPPFDGETLALLSSNILNVPAPDVRTLGGGANIPEGFALVIARCLEKDRAKRYQTADALAEALTPFVDPAAHPPLVEREDSGEEESAPATKPYVPARPHYTLPLLSPPSAKPPPPPAEAQPSAVAPLAQSVATTSSTPDRPVADAKVVSNVAVSYRPEAPRRPSSKGLLVAGALIGATAAGLIALRALSPDAPVASRGGPRPSAVPEPAPSVPTPPEPSAHAMEATSARGAAELTTSEDAGRDVAATPASTARRPAALVKPAPSASATRVPPAASPATSAPPPTSASSSPLKLKLE